MAAALIFAACGGDSGNNGTETDGTSSSSGEISSSGGEVTSSSGDDFSSSGISSGSSSSSDLSSSANGSSSSAKTVSSSSSAVASSSSAETISSSSSLAVSSSSAKAAWNYLNPNITYGKITDPRDGQVYKTVVIGTQTWMAENLNYADSIAMPNLKEISWCYNNSMDSCAKYGRLYTWTAAMDIARSYQSATAAAVISVPHQGVCPTGWHLPDTTEWNDLEAAVGGESTAGTVLKSTGGWQDSGNGTDAYGFSALPAGYRSHFGGFYNAGYGAYFWSATEYDAGNAYRRYLNYDVADMYTYNNDKYNAFSVRCVKD